MEVTVELLSSAVDPTRVNAVIVEIAMVEFVVGVSSSGSVVYVVDAAVGTKGGVVVAILTFESGSVYAFVKIVVTSVIVLKVVVEASVNVVIALAVGEILEVVIRGLVACRVAVEFGCKHTASDLDVAATSK